MNSELEVLKNFWNNKGETNIRLISSQTGFGLDYIRYICNCLLKKGQIKPVKEKRDWYKITSEGKRELKLRGIIKPKLSRKAKDVEKVIYYLPKKLKTNPQEVKIKIKKPKEKLIKAEEKKLNLGRSIAKAVSFLKRSIKVD